MGILLVEVYERVGKSVIFGLKKFIHDCKKVDKSSWFCDFYSYFKDVF